MASVVPEIPVLARDQAFETLYRRYVRDVYHYALALLRNPSDAEDVTQTTFMNAYCAWKRGDEILKPHNWLIKIAHNVARTRFARASRRVKEVPLDDHLEQLAISDEEKPNVEAVLRALGRLPFNQRAALVMRELEGRSYAEISDTIGVSVPAVETLIFRARRSLRLRASSLRSIGAVPLPSSLTQLFTGGGAVAGAGGGGFLGAGFLVKAALMLVAGMAATGIAREQIVRATTTPTPAARIAIVPPWGATPVSARTLRGLSLQTIQTNGGIYVRQMPVITVMGPNGVPLQELVVTTANGAFTAPIASLVSSVVTALPIPASAPQVLPPATNVTTTAQQVVANATAGLPVAVPAIPVKPPAVPVGPPTLPVGPPSLPVTPPALPMTVPTLPVTPPALPVTVPSPPVGVPSLPVSAPTVPSPPVKVPSLPPPPVPLPSVPALP